MYIYKYMYLYIYPPAPPPHATCHLFRTTFTVTQMHVFHLSTETIADIIYPSCLPLDTHTCGAFCSYSLAWPTALAH